MAAEGARIGGEIRIGERGARNAARVLALLVHADGPVHAIVDHQHDDRRAHHRSGERPRAASDHHQQRLGRGREAERIRMDELVVPDELQAGDAAEEPRLQRFAAELVEEPLPFAATNA